MSMATILHFVITWRRVLVATLLTVCLMLVFTVTSEAHAILLRSDPAENSVLHAAPHEVRLWFSEGLNTTLSTATVVNAANQRVDRGDAHVSSRDLREMDVTLPPNLPSGTYVVSWRAASDDDGHIVPGSLLFTVARADGTVPPVSGGGKYAPNLSDQFDGLTLFNLAMITLVGLGAIFWVGAHLWQLFVLQPVIEEHEELSAVHQQIQQRFERRFSFPVLLVLLLANGGVLLGQAFSITGRNIESGFTSTLLGTLITSGHFGAYWLMREIVIVLGLFLSLYLLRFKERSREVNHVLSWANLLLGLALFLAITMSSHAAAVSGDKVFYALVMDWLHVLAAALWIGGMMYIATIYLPVLRSRPMVEQADSLLTVLPHYSPWAIAGVVIMAVTGPFSATTRMSSWEQLLTTLYGQVLVLKILLVGALLVTSAIHVFLLRPRLAREYAKYAYVIEHARSSQAGAEPDRVAKRITQQLKRREGRLTKRTQWLTSVLRWEPILGVAVLICVGLMNVFGGTLSPSGTASTLLPTPTKSASATTSVIAARGEFREYPLPQSNSQVMRLALDHEGRLWFGEMGQNYLAVFDPRTQTFQQQIPPHGRFGMMGIQVAADDTIWFAEQYANYIGHYFPTTGRYQIYPLPRLTAPDPGTPGKMLSLPSAPNELALDAHGNVWFTEFNADSLGRLDPRTGHIQQYPLSAKRSVQKLYPYGLTIDLQGMIWFTELSNDQIGRLDPATGSIRFFTKPGPRTPLMEIASDPHGIIWVTSFSSGLLLSLNPRTGIFTSYYASFTGRGTGGLYGLVVTPTGEVWITVLAENVIARLDVAAKRFIYYRIPTPGSEPLALVMGANHTLWFNEVDKIGMLRP